MLVVFPLIFTYNWLCFRLFSLNNLRLTFRSSFNEERKKIKSGKRQIFSGRNFQECYHFDIETCIPGMYPQLKNNT